MAYLIVALRKEILFWQQYFIEDVLNRVADIYVGKDSKMITLDVHIMQFADKKIEIYPTWISMPMMLGAYEEKKQKIVITYNTFAYYAIH